MELNLTNSDNDSVVVFTPHSKPVAHLDFSNISNKLLSCSYDSTLRCGDFEKGVFDEIFSVPLKDDDLLRNFDFIDDGNCMLVSHSRDKVSLVDIRTPGTNAEHSYSVNRKILRTVSVHPTSKHHFITAGDDTNINLYDLRMMSETLPKLKKPLQTKAPHRKAIASAYFSPDGSKILSSSADDFILVFDVEDSIEIKLFKPIYHKNNTGRSWLSFRPTWHPFVKDVFVAGSLSSPRKIEVFSAEGTLIKSLQDRDYLKSVCSLNEFHPNHECAIVGASSNGKLHVFM